ncbi:MAG: FGGY-family carbohydrate kinase, partial [Janthinobacterium lividum]
VVAAAGYALPAGGLEEPALWWEAVGAAFAGLRERAQLASVGAVAVDGTSGTVLLADGAGAVAGRASPYDAVARDAGVVARIAGMAGEESAARGAGSPLARMLERGRVGAGMRLLHQADWVAGRLCGRFDVTDENNALKTGYDPVARAWPGWVRGVWGEAGGVLPEVVEPGTVIGTVLPEVAAGLGLAAGVRVAAGTTDGCAAFLATGASEVGEGVTSLGSTLVLKQLVAGPVFSARHGVYSHRLGDLWLAGGASNSGGRALAAWFGPEALARLSARIDPAVASPFDFYPLHGRGERFPEADPGRESRVGFRPDDDVAFLHGLLEGVARVEAQGYRRLWALGGPALRSVRSVGGGAGNAAWTAIRARVVGAAMLPARSEQAAVGVARLALRAVAG